VIPTLSIFNGFQKHWLEELEELNNANFTYSSHGIDFDPAAAVHRQAELALKMSRFGWLYSSTLASTLERSAVRYQRFFALIAEHPGHLLVPTLDVDLVRHTHQLSPAKYALYCRATTSGRFINHDDRVEKDELKSGHKHLAASYCCLWLSRFKLSFYQCFCILVNALLHFLNLVSSYFRLQNISKQSYAWVCGSTFTKRYFQDIVGFQVD
jgi:hypothetical protein